LVEETRDECHRGLAATISDGSVIISMTFDNVVNLQISLDELKFIARAAGTLPQWLLEAEDVPGPSRRPEDAKDYKTTATTTEVEAPVEADESKAERHGHRWNAEEDQRLLHAFQIDKLDVRGISREFGRSPSSIVARLLHLDAIEVISKR
ncbi:hypothetical protein, partial [Yoonia sp. R2-816]|uniref:hypothetical protein n=1 Tax=Yoonia sp. R2-816 TaxID=3342638 RepID=UPI00372C1873